MRGGGRSSLFGRDVEIAALQDSVARAARREGHVVVIEGEAGIGKTALAERVTAAARHTGLAVLASGGDEMTRSRPFAPLLAALTSHLDAHGSPAAGLTDLLTGSPRGSGSLLSAGAAERRQAVADVLAGVIAGAAERAPTLLVVEDLHWIDAASALALHATSRRAAGLPLLVVATTRPPSTDDAERDVARLTAASGSRLRLGPLPGPAIDALVRAQTGLPPGPGLRTLLAGAHGNPLLAGELLRSLVNEGLTEEIDGTLEALADALPASFAERVLQTVSHLGRDARGALRLGAVLGSSFSLTDLAAASGRSVVALVDPVQAAVRAGLLDALGDRLTFRHELVRAAIYEALPAAVRAGVHRHVAARLAETAAPVVTVAEHFARGGQPGDTTAISWLQRGAQEVMASAPETALRLLDRACELSPVGSTDRADLDVDRVEALGLCGRLGEAEALSAHVLRTNGDPQLRARVRQLRAAALLLLNRGSEAGEELLTLADDVPLPASVRALAEAAICFMVGADFDRAGSVALRARDSAGPTGTGVGQGLALGVMSRLASTQLHFARSLRLAKEGLAAADRDGAADAHMYQPLFFTGMSSYDLDRFDDTLADVAAGRAISAERGWAVSGAPYAALAAMAQLRAGRLAEAAAEAAAGIELDSGLAFSMCNALAALVALHRDDVPAAQAAVTAGEAALVDGPTILGLDLLLHARALVDEATGDLAAAWSGLHGAWSMLMELGMENMAGALSSDVVRLAVTAGETGVAEDVCAFMVEVAERVALESWHAAVAVARGLVTSDPALLLLGVERYQGSPRVLDAAQAVEHAGRALVLQGDVVAGRRLLRESLTTFEACGALRDRRRVAVALRAAGGRSTTSRTPPSASGWDSLSRSEREVAELVATGLPNAEVAARLFISRRTVETHLYRIYGKLGVRSRTELAMLDRATSTSP